MLRVWVDSKETGVVDRSGYKGSTFVYDLKARQANAVSLTMPKRTQSWDDQDGLLPVFDMNLPEGSLRDRLRLRFAKAAGSFDDFDLLEIVGLSQIGRMRYTGIDNPLTQDVPFQSIDEIIKAKRDGELFEYLMQTFDVYSGVAGVQPKVMIRAVDDANQEEARFRQSASVKGATHIVKMWNPDEYPELAANEFYCLSVALEAGLEVPDFQLSEDGSALVIERFDLGPKGYKGFEDFCVLNGVRSDQKYRGGYETRLFKRLKDYLAPEHTNEDLEKAFRLFVLNCAVRNGDAHLKNFGVTYDNAQADVRLAPVFDVITTRAYLPVDSMALTVDGSTNWPDRKKIEMLGRTRANLKPQKVKEIIEETCDAMSLVAPRVEAYFKDSPYPHIGDRMLINWEDGIKSLGHDRTFVPNSEAPKGPK